MKYFKYTGFFLIAVFILFSCSKKQEDVDKLADELAQQEVTDTTSDTLKLTDTLGETIRKPFPDTVIYVAEEEEAMPAQPAGSGYTVQVASCTDEDYARYLVELYAGRGYEPYVLEVSIDAVTFFRVRIGMYENYSDAVALQTELMDKYTLETWIDEVTM